VPYPLFSAYRQGENRITSSTLAVFERIDLPLLQNLVETAGGGSAELVIVTLRIKWRAAALSQMPALLPASRGGLRPRPRVAPTRALPPTYERISQSRMPSKGTLMNATVAALLGSLIGAAAALAGAVFTSVIALKNEIRRQESKAQTVYVRALRERSGAAFAQFFTIVQAIEWISCMALTTLAPLTNRGSSRTKTRSIVRTETLLGAMAMTASLNLTAYEEMRPILSNLYSLEARVGVALRQIRSERSTAIQELSTCKSEAATLRDDLPPKLNHIMAVAETIKP